MRQTVFDFVGGNAAVDFVNTEIMHQGERVDLIPDFIHFMAWLEQNHLVNMDVNKAIDVVDKSSMYSLLERWHQTSESEALMVHVYQLRRNLRAAFEQVHEKQTIEAETLETLNEQFRLYPGFYQLGVETKGVYQQFMQYGTMPSHLLTSLIKEIVDFLSEADFSLIKHCGNSQCIRYFYDTTKNRSRRWCSMETCGNRMKVAAYYQRKRNSSS
ncbi:MAG: CGNR zinc finger domain-containing protein [Chloroflexota bacterium]